MYLSRPPPLPHGALSALRVIIALIPATLAILFAALILFIALFLNEPRREYAINAASRLTKAAVNLIAPTRQP
jgi:hypothetical protein